MNCLFSRSLACVSRGLTNQQSGNDIYMSQHTESLADSKIPYNSDHLSYNHVAAI